MKSELEINMRLLGTLKVKLDKRARTHEGDLFINTIIETLEWVLDK